jgi:septum site-determining protein MinC
VRGKIDFKGTKDGIVLLVKGDLTFEWIQILVQKKLKQARHFFEGAHIIGSSGFAFSEDQEVILSQLIQAQSGMKVLNLEPYDFSRDVMQKGMVAEAPVRLSTYSSEMDIPVGSQMDEADSLAYDTNESTLTMDFLVSQDQELEHEEHEEHEEQVKQDEQEEVGSYTYGARHSEEMTEIVSDTIFHRGTLRSGRRVVSTGNIVILGDVNPGAELVARGNIIVMGNMRGLAHAGSDGNEKAFVAAIRLMPTQIRIDKIISRPPDEGHEDAHYPEIAYVQDGKMIIEPYL